VPVFFGFNFEGIIVVILKNINTFVLLKRIFYIILLIGGFNLTSNAQVKSTFTVSDVVKTVKFYPNPAASFINFEFDKDYDDSYSVVIFNFIGKKVTEFKVAAQKITVSLTDYYRGVYIFQLKDRLGNVIESGKFQVVK